MRLSALLTLVCVAVQINAQQTAFVGATLIDGTGGPPIENSVLLVYDGRVAAVGTRESVSIPDTVAIHNVSGMTIIPGLINTHGHVGDVKGIEAGHYSAENIRDQLARYARYGITTVVSLGDDRKEAEPFRNILMVDEHPAHARLYIAGPVVTGNTPQQAIQVVDRNVAMGVDFIKIRVDDNLGASPKMRPEVYQAVIKRAHEYDKKLAVHLYYLDDAKAVLQAGADFIAHSVRDTQVDKELIDLLKEKNVAYCPTLTRDLSTFVYESTPEFFSDPLFIDEFGEELIAPLKDPQRQERIRNSASAQTYKQALETALMNLKILSDNGVLIAFGTDSGVATRFQGYFEHMELDLMARAGMSPLQIILSATGNAAKSLDLKEIGTLVKGNQADFVILDKNPLEDIQYIHRISEVWVGGKKVER